MAPEQRRYAMAKAKLETLRAAAKPELDAVWAELDKAEDAESPDFRALVDREIGIQERYGILAAQSEMVQAERALIDWVRATMERLPQYKANAATLAPLWEKWYLPSIHNKLIDMAMRLAA
jgi:hypothetical protein